MKRLPAILISFVLAAVGIGVARGQEGQGRSGYSYVREAGGEVSINSRYNGRVEARSNLPISAGDEIEVADGGHAEVALADGNVLFVGGRTKARFVSLHDQQGEEDAFSAINLTDGSVAIYAGGDNEDQIPRVDTEDATVYLSPGARVRVNFDPRRGTAVIGRTGTTEVRTRAGTFRLRAGEYLEARGDEEPQVERGTFSRDRFDIWVADQIESFGEGQTRSASARYVDQSYAGDVAAMDDNGDWQYSDEYGTDVWSPRVDAGWSPYSNGSWYYTPVGMTWWSYDPWGWFPFHYGSWFFSASWNRWCWRPAFVYSPAWVYWAYTPSFIGWCPFGWYSFWSPWYNNYYRNLGWSRRNNFFIGIQGTFSTRTVDFRGWNFTGTNHFGTPVARMDVIPGARIADRLGTATVAVSSRPIVVNARPGQAREAVQGFIRQAPRVIERSSSASDSARLAPILSRQRTLPPATLEAVQQRAVVAERGRLAGPGVADVAPRGALVERSRSLSQIAREPARTERGRVAAEAPVSPRQSREVTEQRRSTLSPEADWRSRSTGRPAERPDVRSIERSSPGRGESPPAEWRSRGGTAAPNSTASPPRSISPRSEDWRSRSDVPPARRVIEGAVPGRRAFEAAPNMPSRSDSWRSPERSYLAPPAYRGRDFRSEVAPRVERPPVYSAPPQRAERPSYSAPQPRAERPSYSAPPRAERPSYSAPPRAERPSYSAPPPRAERPSYSAPPRAERPSYSAPPRGEVHHSAPPSSNRGRRDR